MKLTKIEKETIILFNEAEQTAGISTYNSVLIKRLDGFCNTRPDEIKLISTGSTGCREYELPKKWIKINVGIQLSDEQRAIRSERGKQAALNFKR